MNPPKLPFDVAARNEALGRLERAALMLGELYESARSFDADLAEEVVDNLHDAARALWKAMAPP